MINGNTRIRLFTSRWDSWKRRREAGSSKITVNMIRLSVHPLQYGRTLPIRGPQEIGVWIEGAR